MLTRLAHRALRLLESNSLSRGAMLRLERHFWQQHVWRLRREAGERAHAQAGGRVAGGLFAGMLVDPGTSWGMDQYTVLGGQYEAELQPILTDAIARGHARYVDIGCANGFYAVGMALAAPAATVLAFDIDPAAREATARNARLNCVADRVEVRAEADWATLDAELAREPDSFIICDIEGAELTLLDPDRCPRLRDVDLLVEVHGDLESMIAVLTERFAPTHDVKRVGRTARNPFIDPLLPLASEDHAWAMMSEGRTFTRDNWLFMKVHR